jgi:spermidine synthase
MRYLIYFFFLLSGATGLVYEMLWIRLLGLSLGNTMYAISAVLATFMTGLAIGGYAAGQYLETHKRPLRLYGLLELGIGLWALLIPFLLKGVNQLHNILDPIFEFSVFLEWLLHFGLSCLSLLIPAILMGSTLPVLTTYFTKHLAQVGEKLTLLYALNTLGAVLGTWWVGFYALPWLGVSQVNIITVLINLTIGGLCVLFDYKLVELPAELTTKTEQLPSQDRRQTLFLVGGAFVAGVSAMMCEIAWTRILTTVLGSSTYAFSCILIAFLTGIFLGSEIHGWIRKIKEPGLIEFCLVEILVGGACLLTLPAFSFLPHAYLILYHLLSPNIWTIQALRILLPLSVMIVPTILMGAAFPMVGGVYARTKGRISSGVGNIYGANTLGNVCGALAAGFFLLTNLGVQNTLKIAIILNLCVGVIGVISNKTNFRQILTGTALLIGVLTFLQHSWDKYLMDSGISVYAKRFNPMQPFRGWISAKMLYFKEGINGLVTVYQDPEGNRTLRINGKSDASTNPEDMLTQLSLGYIPLFLHPTPHRALVIGLGSGVTARIAAQYDFIQQVDCLEIEPAVVEAAKFFKQYNHDIYWNPKVHFVIEDGRAYLNRSSKLYDLIISEPSNPWIKGIGNLFSFDFYRLCRQRLARGGIMCQWIHSYDLPPAVFQMAVNSFRQAFPYCQLWFLPKGNDALILGSESPITLDFDHIMQLINYNDDIKQELKRGLAVDSPQDLLSYFMLNNNEVIQFTKGAELNSDNYPRLEFIAPRYIGVNTGILNYKIIRKYKKDILPPNIKPTGKQVSRSDYYRKLSKVLLSAGFNKEAFEYINQALKLDGQDSKIYLIRGQIFAKKNAFQKAIDDFKRSLELDSENFECHVELARTHQIHNRWREAQTHYLQALKLAPQNEEIQFEYANFLATGGNNRQALSLARNLTSAIALKSYQVWSFIGDIHSRINNLEEARLAYEKSYKLNPADFRVNLKLGQVYLAQGKIHQALEKFNSSREIFAFYDPNDMRLLNLISDSYIRLQQYDKAAQALQEILRHKPEDFNAYQKLISLPGNRAKYFF